MNRLAELIAIAAVAIAAANAAMIDSLKDVVIVCSDVGFQSELDVIIHEFGANNVLLFRLHRDGCGFENDTRSHLYCDDICSVDIRNDNKTKLMFDVFGNTLHWYDFGTAIKGVYA
jgi:hypothetical protein